MKSPEIYSLTGLRGVAALMVMLYHFELGDLLTGRSQTFLGHGYLMVDLFIVLSGFIIAMTYGERFSEKLSWSEYKSYSLRRIARIYPLYALTTITAGILVATGWMDRWPGPEVYVSALLNFTMLQCLVHVPSLNTPTWSLSAEWIANLLFPFIAFLSLKRSWLFVAIMGVLAFITLPILTHLPSPKRAGLLDIWHYSNHYPVVRCIADSILGIICFRVWQLHSVKRFFAFSWLAPFLLALIIGLMTIKTADIWVVALFPAFILALIPENNSVSKIMGSKWIYRLGGISYAIYLIHNHMNYFMIALAKYLVGCDVSQVLASLISIIIFSVIVIFLSDLSYRYIEQPARKWMNSLFSSTQKNRDVNHLIPL